MTASEETLTEGVTSLNKLVERIRYRNDLLPSEVTGEMQKIVERVGAKFSNSPPADWTDLLKTTRMFLAEGAKAEREPGVVEKLHGIIEQDGAQLLANEKRRVTTSALLANGGAIRRADWDRCSPADQNAHIAAGKQIFD
jgi:hypothetical protein